MKNYFECTYQWMESAIRHHQDGLRAENIQHVVAILRGGTVPAFMAAHILDAELYFLNFSRAELKVSWHSGAIPPERAKILLVDDIAGAGETLVRSKAFLEGLGYEVKTLTIGRDDLSRLTPDFSTDFGNSTIIFPWERHRLAKEFIKDLGESNFKADSAYGWTGLDLDGLLLPDLPDQMYRLDLEGTLKARDAMAAHALSFLPAIDRKKTVIITGRPEMDYDRTRRWLDANGFSDLALHCRSDEAFKHEVAWQFKAEKCRELGVTTFYESDLLQATYMTHHAPLLDVYCWNNDLKIRIKLGPSRLL